MERIAHYGVEPSSLDAPAGADVIGVALLHPKQALVDALEVLLAPQPDIEVVAAHTDLDWIRLAVSAGDVNVLLIDGNDHADDPPVIEELRSASAGLGVVVIADADESATLSEAVRAGVRGWVGRDASVDDLVQVIRGVHRGETWFPPAVATKLLDSLLGEERLRRQAWGELESLSSRELEVLRCLMNGLTRQQIAERFVLSPHTVRTHVNNLLRKLNVHSTLAAVSIARQAGLSEGEKD
ncbi:MAG TPA: response regulator transcription factor [Nocardioidaceae bacterium]|nr:response regulator transcription factor [Nocardioidaceae bacterium]